MTLPNPCTKHAVGTLPLHIALDTDANIVITCHGHYREGSDCVDGWTIMPAIFRTHDYGKAIRTAINHVLMYHATDITEDNEK